MRGNRSRVFVFAIVAVILLGYGYYHVFSTTAHPVIPGEIYRGAQFDTDVLEATIIDKGIRSVINLRGAQTGKHWYDDEVALTTSLGVRHFDLSLSSRGLPRRRSVLELIRLIEQAERPLLVHCEAGVDRSGFASLAALLGTAATTLDDASQHVSIRYFVDDADSIGRLFYGQYKQWLATQKLEHSAENFRHWVTNDYVDAQGNFYYYIDSINGEVLKNGTLYTDGYTFNIDSTQQDALVISGWAFDDVTGSPVAGVAISLDGEPAGQVNYGLPRADVAKAFASPALELTGWSLQLPLERVDKGCHLMTQTLTRRDGSSWQSPVEARVCIN